MDPSLRKRQADAIFSRALELSPQEQLTYLESACEGDPALRSQVEALLTASREEETLLRPGGALAGLLGDGLEASLARPLAPGERVGSYRVVRELGRGGMAVVYLAERADGQFEQEVALKLIRQGADSDEVLARFAQERQILASLDHPNIARLLDGGVTAAGRPYFALERVEGEPIDVYCDQRRLTVRQRLELFLDAARAVEAAHRNLVVHRDLKPSNILVTQEGQVKLLDFGIAKLLDPWAVGQTRTQLRPMTPEYASPEQFRGEVVSTASDVYQLGVLLYVLLTGRRPHGDRETTPAALERAVCELEPKRPSRAVSEPPTRDTSEAGTSAAMTAISEARHSRPERLRRQLAGDLDNIVLKALSKEPARRYRSVGRLVDDVERHLAGLPVTARRASVAYRTGKLLRRHTLAAGLTVVLVSLVVLLLVLQGRRLAEERDRARRDAEKARQVATFVTRFLEVLDPYAALGGQVSARRLLDEGTANLGEELQGQPEIQTRFLVVAGDLYRKLGDFEQSREVLEQALALQLPLYGEQHEETARSRFLLGHLALREGRFAEARRQLEQALAVQESVLGLDHPDVARTLGQLSRSVRAYGELDLALAYGQRALAIQEKAYGPRHPEVAEALLTLSGTERSQDLYSLAIEHLERALAIQEEALGANHPWVGRILSTLAQTRRFAGETEGLLPLYERSLGVLRNSFGPNHPDLAPVFQEYGLALADQGDMEAARTNLEEGLRISRLTYGLDSTTTLVAEHYLASTLLRMGLAAEARPYFVRILAAQEKSFGADHEILVEPLQDLAASEHAMGDLTAAANSYDRLIALQRRHPDKADTLEANLRTLSEIHSAAKAGEVVD